MKTAIDLIAAERQEQLEKHGRAVEMDVDHNGDMQLTWGAVQLFAPEFGYAVDNDDMPNGWDEDLWRHMLSKTYKERLVIAGALLAAEIDRLSYEESQP